MDPLHTPSNRPVPASQLHDLGVPDRNPDAALTGPKYRLTELYASRCRLPPEKDPAAELCWDLRYTGRPVEAAAELLGVVCLKLSEVQEGQFHLSARLREQVSFNVIHKARSNPAFRSELSDWVEIAPAFDALDRAGELDVDCDTAGVNRWSDEEFTSHVLEMFSLAPLVQSLREIRGEEPRRSSQPTGEGETTS